MLSERALNRALLARQLYLDRSDLPIPQALDLIAGIQNQYAPAGYISLWSRLTGFRRHQLTSALERGKVVQGTSIRSTIHLVTPEFFQLSNAAVREERTAWWFRATGRHDQLEMQKVAKEIEAALRKGPQPRNLLIKELGIDSATWNGAVNYLDLIRVPPSGTWEKRRADLYGLLPTKPIDPEEARRAMVDRYLRAFGPAGVADAATFLGLRPAQIRHLMADYPTYRGPQGIELFDVEGGLLPDPDTPAPPRFIPVWDATLLVHARRTQILPERYRSRIFNTKTPHSHNTFLIDGQVAGTWKFESGDITINTFEPLDRRTTVALNEERDRLRGFWS
ncbi:MAG TPA: winged helix DNA-binding domain-containing protein [Acidimicrobiia bacterium]|nr:winged helix DNA-binding domain-containing protein [Acidimicrobiia bacterium]